MREWAERNGHSIITEFIEPGASATDDKRPVFQQMIAESCLSPSPVQAVVVHSLSRFFRDMFSSIMYERTLAKAGVKLVSITQQTSDDPAGDMARRIFSLFDEYQSKENAKHTLRGMKENARQGYFNGSRPPFGYRTMGTGPVTVRGRQKKVLEVDQAEAEIVREIFERYTQGRNGPRMGMKEIGIHLNERGVQNARQVVARPENSEHPEQSYLHGRARLQPDRLKNVQDESARRMGFIDRTGDSGERAIQRGGEI